ncbi:MAG TPA: Asp-tRNA(Asn)/Glu-tRNA(Gln) amidotransferase subunit GatA [Candidatus Eisenbacteria bacterium]|nr:Asp-tRNA(Asn)/Glu-tRNA(Gln) amidotransferase subunit GatA [Candidatus Eisenbacteria bacterium]
MIPHWKRSAAELAGDVSAGRADAVEILDAHRAQAARWDPAVHALLGRDDEAARRVASSRPQGPLAGVPFIAKDNLCTRGLRTTCGSRILEPYVPPYDATVIARLRAAGAVLYAKANCDEFAMGSSMENSAFGPSRNPYDLERVPGGSSGGSAVATATGMGTFALGSETGGSVRQPASFTNLVGLKPTYGRLSRYGLVAFGSSLDQVGVFARSVADCALVFSVMAGPDENDMTTRPDGAFSLDGLDVSARAGKGLAIGVPRNILAEGLHPEVQAAQARAEEALGRAGVRVKEVHLVPPAACVATYYLLATAEASSNLARFDGVRYGFRAQLADDLLSLYTKTRGQGFGSEVKRRILLGTFALSAGYYDAYYRKALQARRRIRSDLHAALSGVDALLLPTAPTPAFRLGEKATDPLAMYLSDIFTIGANLAGIPALNVPCGFTADGLPVGMQLVGPAQGEGTLFRLGAALESALGGERRWPELAVGAAS